MARRKPASKHGFVVVDKPAGCTSHDVVDVARRQLGERKIGHSGTLDPDATGVLLLGVGDLTRVLRFLTALGKTYTAVVVLGTATSTQDASGEIVASFDMSMVTLASVRAGARTLTGAIEQIPPMVSAVQIDGVRLHELARQGIEVDRVARPVTVDRFDVEPTADPMRYRIEVACSSGTYVRTLAHDLGIALGGGAHLTDLRRTAVGSFTVEEASVLDALELRPPIEALRDYVARQVDDDLADLVRHGRVLRRDGFVGAGPWPVIDASGRLLAVYEPFADGAKPAVVLASA
jgi:tRNA pseudouridine55 synthase